MGVLVFGFDSDCTEGLIDAIASRFPDEKVFWVTARYDEYAHTDQIQVIRRFELPLFSKIGLNDVNEDVFNSLNLEEYYFLLNRKYKYFGELKPGIKENILRYQLSFWEDFLERNEIRLFINSNLPHETSDYVIYQLCLHRNIETVLFYQVFASCVVALNKIEELGTLMLEKGLERAEPTPAILKFVADRKSLEFKQPFYMKKEKIKRHEREEKKKKLKRRIKKKRTLKTLFSTQNILRLRWVFLKHLKGNQKVVYTKFSGLPDYNQPYLYFPLHYQPEMTSCPMAKNGFYDQLKILKSLVDVLPDDYWVYVKENPKQSWICRPTGVYQSMLDLKKVRLINLDISSDELIEHSKGVVTISGTAGWEALLRDKRVLTFGHVIYNAIKGVFSVDENTLQSNVERLIQKHQDSQKLDLDEFFSKLSGNSAVANGTQYYFNNSINHGEEENVNELLGLLDKILLKQEV